MLSSDDKKKGFRSASGTAARALNHVSELICQEIKDSKTLYNSFAISRIELHKKQVLKNMSQRVNAFLSLKES